MINWRKLAVSGVLASTITFSSISALAVSFDDVSGLDSEISISKLVSLGYMTNSGTYFNPDNGLTRLEYAEISSRIMYLPWKGTWVKDVDTRKGRNASVVRAVRGGLLSLTKKGEFKPKNTVHYSEFAKALAYGLGFKKTWSNRPLDFLYYLDRKGVLDIDTDLDAVVTRGDAAVAVDKYLMVKHGYKSVAGVISDITATGIVVKSQSGESTFKYSNNASLFLDDQAAEKENLGAGTEVQLLLNKKGEVAFVSGTSLQLFDGTLAYDGSGKLLVKDTPYTTNFNVVVNPLPSNPDGDFTYKEFANYSGSGAVTFKGSAYANVATDQVTMISAYITNIADRPVTVAGNAVTFGFKDEFDFNDLTLKLNDAATFKLSDGTTEKDSTLATITAAITATIAANNAKPIKERSTITASADAGPDGTITALSVKIVAPAPAPAK